MNSFIGVRAILTINRPTGSLWVTLLSLPLDTILLWNAAIFYLCSSQEVKWKSATEGAFTYSYIISFHINLTCRLTDKPQNSFQGISLQNCACQVHAGWVNAALTWFMASQKQTTPSHDSHTDVFSARVGRCSKLTDVECLGLDALLVMERLWYELWAVLYFLALTCWLKISCTVALYH